MAPIVPYLPGAFSDRFASRTAFGPHVNSFKIQPAKMRDRFLAHAGLALKGAAVRPPLRLPVDLLLGVLLWCLAEAIRRPALALAIHCNARAV